MTPDQALAILDQATSRVQMDRSSHLQVIEALKVLGRMVHPMPTNSVQTPRGPVALQSGPPAAEPTS